eukprot:TRINITY_DN66060_c0_g1_i1.p1 TRINITY_DN66060_c0_g1~~TRINITY_DN66060_c0_g1_i1.p1  ORF type:complete len:304 (+),score=11.48 TRINITY_DN66060_c0_g1_i1:43-954(+)
MDLSKLCRDIVTNINQINSSKGIIVLRKSAGNGWEDLKKNIDDLEQINEQAFQQIKQRITDDDDITSAMLESCLSYLVRCTAEHPKKHELFNLLISCDKEDNCDVECFICGSGRLPSDFIEGVCCCKLPVHTYCIRNVIAKMGDTCKTCNTKYRRNQQRLKSYALYPRVDDPHTLFFPSCGHYPVALSGHQFRVIPVDNLVDRMYCALLFFQTDELQSLAERISDADFWKFAIQARSGIRLIKCTKNSQGELLGEVEMATDCPQSNLARANNEQAYKEAEEILTRRLSLYISRRSKADNTAVQ